MKPSTQKRWQETRELLQEALQTWDSLKPSILGHPDGEGEGSAPGAEKNKEKTSDKSTDKLSDKIHDEKLQDLFRQLQEKIKNLS